MNQSASSGGVAIRSINRWNLSQNTLTDDREKLRKCNYSHFSDSRRLLVGIELVVRLSIDRSLHWAILVVCSRLQLRSEVIELSEQETNIKSISN